MAQQLRYRPDWFCAFCLWLLVVCPAWSQYNFKFDQSIAVKVGDQELAMPWGGGLNASQYQSLDINLDGAEDLVVFDRTSNKINCFINVGGTYVYSPEYAHIFPKEISNWLVFADYNCDGQKDLFTSSVFGIKVYQGVVQNGMLKWELVADPIYTVGFAGQVNLQVNVSDIPAIVDVDGDGDLDILVFNFAGAGTIEYHQNFSIEDEGACGLNFRRTTNKWGDFEECTCGVYAIGTSCAAITGKGPPKNQMIMHAGGKALLLLDMDGDGDMEMIFGDEGCYNLAYFENVGSPSVAAFQSFQEDFPPENYPDFLFPAGYYLDVDQDGVKDLMVSPNISDGVQYGVDLSASNWFYKNTGSNNQPDFQLVEKAFLQGKMIDRGENAAPALVDLDQDGRIDLLVGHRGVLRDEGFYATLAYYKNVGSQTHPAFSLLTDDFLHLSSLGLTHLYPGIADINGDGYADLYFTGTTDQDNTALYYVLSEQGKINSDMPIKTLPITLSVSDKPLMADLDGDGFAELILLRGSGRMEYYTFSGSSQAPGYTLVHNSLGGFTDKFENRNLTLACHDFDGDGKLEFILSDVFGKMHLIKDIFQHDTGLAETDSLTVSNSVLSFTASMRVGRQARPAFAVLSEGQLPTMVVGSKQGGLFLFQPSEWVQNPDTDWCLLMQVYPNPADGFFKIEAKEDISIMLYNALGEQIGPAFTVNKDEIFQYNTVALAAGIYFVKAINRKGKTETFKVIVL